MRLVKSTDPHFRRIRVAFALIASLSTAQAGELHGRVTARDGRPIEGVAILSSGRIIQGFTTSAPDGSFRLSDAGALVVFHHRSFQPRLLRSEELTESAHVQLDVAGESTWRIKPCPHSSRGKAWIGRYLRFHPGQRYKGPVYGEHDEHWYIRRGKDTLHVSNGLYFLSLLPTGSAFTDSSSISVRAFVGSNISGLEFSGISTKGEYWRWAGAILHDAIEYSTPNRKTAAIYDRIIATMCEASTPAP